MQYQVPQFIDVEDKVVGPLTLRQFIYLAGSGGLAALFFTTLPLIFAVLLTIPFAGLGVALAFYKINNKPFAEILEAGFTYLTGKKFFLWKKEEKTVQAVTAAAAAAKAAEEAAALRTPKLTRGKLSELAWSLDVKNQSGSNPD